MKKMNRMTILYFLAGVVVTFLFISAVLEVMT